MPIPDWLPGEPPPRTWGRGAVAVELLRRLALLVLAWLVSLPAWPLWAIVRLFRPRPPNAAPLPRLLHWLALTGSAPLSPAQRLALRLALLRRVALAPWPVLAWTLDEVLYGRALARTPIVAPLFEISAARSGSTQLARYLEADPALAAPTLLQTVLPYRWAWRLYELVGARLVPPDRIREAVRRRVPPAWLERHELDPFAIDSFEMAYLLLVGGDYASWLGGGVLADGFSAVARTPGNAAHWDDFVAFLDALGRKVLLHRPGTRLFVKGHFLAAAPALAARYPDARFLTMVREPVRRLHSVLNFLHDQPGEELFARPSWDTVVAFVLATELPYCDAEMAFFTEPAGPRRHVVRFDAYLRDLPGTIAGVYAACLEHAPPRPPTEHAHRKRHGYAIDRSLEQLGLDPAALSRDLAAYTAWVQG